MEKNKEMLISKIFDHRNLIIFKYFTSGQWEDIYCDSEIDIIEYFEHFMLYDILIKLKNIESEIIVHQNLDMLFYFKFFLKKKIRHKKSCSINSYCNFFSLKKFENVRKKYNELIKNSENYTQKEPFASFGTSSNIFENSNKFNIFIQIICSYIYISLIFNERNVNFQKKDENYSIIDYNHHPKSLIKVMKIFKKFKNIKNSKICNNHISDDNSENKSKSNSSSVSLYLLNLFFNFLKNLPKKNFSMLDNNESFYEYLIHFLVIVLDYNPNFFVRNKRLYKFLNSRLLLETSIMLLNLNKSNKIFCKKLSIILNSFLVNKSHNLLVLLNIFNSSDIGIEQCSFLIKNLFLFYAKQGEWKNLEKILNYMMNLILTHKVNDVEKGIQVFFTGIIETMLLELSDNLRFTSIMFRIFFEPTFKKFGLNLRKILDTQSNLILQRKEFETSEKSEMKICYYGQKFITKKQSDYYKFLISNFDLVFKNSFQKLLEYNEPLFKITMEILISLFRNTPVYYLNLKNKYFSNLTGIFLLILENYDYTRLAELTVNYYIKNIFKIIRKETENFNLINVSFDNFLEDSKICIAKQKYGYLEFLEFICSKEYSLIIINSIQNLFNMSPFNKAQFQVEILYMFLEQKISLSNTDEDFFDEFLNKENEESNIWLSQLPSKLRNLKIIIKHQILVTILNNPLIFDDNIHISMQEILKTLIFILKSTDGKSYTLEPKILDSKKSYSEEFSIKEQSLSLIILVLEKIKNENSNNNLNFNEILTFIEGFDHRTQENEIKKIKHLIVEISCKVNSCNETKHSLNDDKIKNYCEEISNKSNKINNITSIIDKAFLINDMIILIKKLNSQFRNENIIEKSDLSFVVNSEFISKLYNVGISNYRLTDQFLSKKSGKFLIEIFELILRLSKNGSNLIRLFFDLFTMSFKTHLDLKSNLESTQISLENQVLLKLSDLLEKIIKRNKQGCAIFYDQLVTTILNIFELYYLNIDSSVLSGLISVFASLLNYVGLQMGSYLPILIRTVLNNLETSMSVEVKRSSALLLFKVIQNCYFDDYKIFAEKIYWSVKLNMQKPNIDPVFKYHLEKCDQIIQECVQNFYEIN